MPTTIVVRGPDDAVLRFAAEELARYAARLIGESASRGEPGLGTNIVLTVDPEVGSGDTFLLRSSSEGLVIASSGSRGVLHGVYAYLETLGVRFPFPGEEHEVVPRRELAIDGYDRRETPSFERRGMTFSGNREHALGWIDFCGKHRLNWVFHHTQFADQWWIENRDVLWPELQKRGISLELGGHYLPHFIPRQLFHEHPDWFRLVNGARVNDYNFCPSSKEAIEYLKERVRQYVRENPEAEVYNVWADDTAEDVSTWCFCDKCRQYSPSDQNLLVMNAMAQAVRDEKASGKMVHIAYHETVVPPEKVEPDPGVVLMFAPRERCYAHCLNDPECAKNRQHAAWLEKLVKTFDPAEAEIFEYYPDQVVFNHMMPALADTIAGDLRYYKSLGIGLIEPLLTPSTHPWISPPASAILQCKGLWDLDADLNEVLADHARTYFGEEAMVEYFRARERALNRTIRACDFTHPVASFWTPPIDKPEVTARHLDGLEESLADLYLARRALARASRMAVGEYAERINKEEQAFNLASRRVNGQAHLARGLLALDRFQRNHDPVDARQAIDCFEHAHADLNEVFLRAGRPWRTFIVADVLIGRVLAESGGTRRGAPAASQLVARMPSSLIPERAESVQGVFGLSLRGRGGGVWTITIEGGACTVAEGRAERASGSVEMEAEEFAAMMVGEIPAAAMLGRSSARLTGDAVRLARLPYAFRLGGLARGASA